MKVDKYNGQTPLLVLLCIQYSKPNPLVETECAGLRFCNQKPAADPRHDVLAGNGDRKLYQSIPVPTATDAVIYRQPGNLHSRKIIVAIRGLAVVKCVRIAQLDFAAHKRDVAPYGGVFIIWNEHIGPRDIGFVKVLGAFA